jgi:3-dehydroquinate dehydratase
VITLNLNDEQAIRLYKKLREYKTCADIDVELSQKLVTLEMDEYQKRMGSLTCFHCSKPYPHRIRLAQHIREYSGCGLKEAIDLMASWYEPSLILMPAGESEPIKKQRAEVNKLERTLQHYRQ